MMAEGLGTDLTVLVVSLAIIPAVLACLLLCLKIRASRSNQDIYGLEGTVKKKTEDVLNTSNSEKHHLSVDDTNIRTPSYDRKLPEIPDDIYKASLKEDNSSDLYATVDDNQTRTLSPQGATAVSEDHAHHPYAKVKKQRKEEHPYAKVGESQNGKPEEPEEEDDETEYETTEKLQTLTDGPGFSPPTQGFPQGASFSPWIPPPNRHPSRQATPLPAEPAAQQAGQQHFSGDSQDSTYSTKGYTSISVREPLENLRSAVPPSQPTIQEGNYVTLSETSDEMYAAIEDNVYMDPEGPPRQKGAGSVEDPSLMYSKIDKKKKRTERQTASYDGGYATAASYDRGYATVNKLRQSPSDGRAGPRQRYSALPFNAASNSEVDYSGYEVTRVDNWNPRSADKSKIDPGYETVPYSQQRPGHQLTYSREGRPTYPQSYSRDPGYEVLPGEKKLSESRDPDYEIVPSQSQTREPGYETLPHRFRSDSFDPGYETLSKRTEAEGPRSYPEYSSTRYREYREPGYETVAELRLRDPDYESVINSRGAEPGYETVPDRVQHRAAANGVPVPVSRTYTPSPPRPGNIAGGRLKSRAAPAFKSPPPSPLSISLRLNHIYRSSEPELNRTGGPDSTVGYESLRTYPNLKFSLDIEEGYETIPPSLPQTLRTSPAADTRHASPPGDRRSGARPDSVSANGGTKYRRDQTPANRSDGQRRLSSEAETRISPAMEPGYEQVRHGGVNSTSRDLKFTEKSLEDANTNFEKLNSEDINFIDEDIDSVPGTPGSPTIHMSVVDNGPGKRRASVVLIERFEEEVVAADPVNQETHIFV